MSPFFFKHQNTAANQPERHFNNINGPQNHQIYGKVHDPIHENQPKFHRKTQSENESIFTNSPTNSDHKSEILPSSNNDALTTTETEYGFWISVLQLLLAALVVLVWLQKLGLEISMLWHQPLHCFVILSFLFGLYYAACKLDLITNSRFSARNYSNLSSTNDQVGLSGRYDSDQELERFNANQV